MSEAILTELISHQYGVQDVSLKPIHHFVQAERGIYRVNQIKRAPLLLRAIYGDDANSTAWLLNSASILQFLAQHKFPAPRVIRTANKEYIGEYQGWSSLMLTFIEGEVAQGKPSDLWEIGAALAHLHSLDTSKGPLPDSRFHPAGVVKRMSAQHAVLQTQVPTQLSELYTTSRAIFERVSQWPELPEVILHTDPWANNAIRTSDQHTILIDWDGTGLGPAILDVGYLLVHCLATLPAWPVLDPKPEQIHAVVDGYCQVRTPSYTEVEYLFDAIAFAVIYHDIRDFELMLIDDAFAERSLQRYAVRYPAVDAIVRLATQRFERYL